MDSDDDFMTDASSADDFLDTQGSEDESLGEGMLQRFSVSYSTDAVFLLLLEFGDEFDGGFSQDKDLA